MENLNPKLVRFISKLNKDDKRDLMAYLHDGIENEAFTVADVNEWKMEDILSVIESIKSERKFMYQQNEFTVTFPKKGDN